MVSAMKVSAPKSDKSDNLDLARKIGDVIRRGHKKQLPCTLTDHEFVLISKQRVEKEALLDQLVVDFQKIKKKHNDAVEEVEDEIKKMRQELHTGEQERMVPCADVFRRGEDGAGYVHTLRMDVLLATYNTALADGATEADAIAEAAEHAIVERRPATPAEAQRYLPGVEGEEFGGAPLPLLEQAAALQAAEPVPVETAADGVDDGVPAELAGDAQEDDGLSERTAGEAGEGGDGQDEPDDGELGDGEAGDADDADDADGDEPPADETPAERAARESEEGRAKRRAGGGGKRAAKGKAKS